jgi:hypothetical protein
VLRNTIRSKLALLLAFVAIAVCAPLSCASSTRLDRSKAADLIRRSSQFTQPYAIIIRHQKDSRQLDPISPSETKEQGQARAVEEYFNASPYRGVLRELGLMTASATYVKTTMYGEREGPSLYNLDVRLTEKGEQLWHDLNMPVDPATLPLALRELVQITGITGGDEKSRRATIEFSWKWLPTLAGRAMTRGTPEFERLPERLKKQFNEEGVSVFNIGAHPPLELGGTQRSVATFVLYDDGWRLEPLPFESRPLNPLN